MELIFLKEWMLTKEVHEKRAMLQCLLLLLNKVLSFNQLSAIDVMIFNDAYEP